MLRKILGAHRQKNMDYCNEEDEETWVEWIRRTTRPVENSCTTLGIEGCVELQRRRKWRWAGHVGRMDGNRWANILLQWTPEGGEGRAQGGQLKRWEDILKEFSYSIGLDKRDWILIAHDREEWQEKEQEFLKVK